MALNFLNDGYFAGKVGIGTETPGEKLEVNGNIKVIESGENANVSVFHSDGSYAKLTGNGLFFNRNNVFLAAEADNFASLNIGYPAVRWGNVEINAAFVKFQNGATERAQCLSPKYPSLAEQFNRWISYG